MFSHPYIYLNTPHDLQDDAVICWMKCVIEAGPPGILASTETSPNNKQLGFYMRKLPSGNCYVAVLARDLSGEEATDIAKSYGSRQPDGDFSIRWSQDPVEDTSANDLANDLIKEIAAEAAKLNHNKWLRTKTNEGWRYGRAHDHKNQTSPMCRDWDNLPESYKIREYQRMESLLEIMDKMNLKLSRKRN